jgi:hypothetical protein
MNFLVLALTFFGTFLIGIVAIFNATSQWQRILLFAIISGLFFYSGIGAAYQDVPLYYLLYYFSFLIVFVISFIFFKTVFLKLSRHAKRTLPFFFKSVDKSLIWPSIIFIYLFLLLIPLLYPQLRISQLIKPRFTKLQDVIYARFHSQPDKLLSIVNYLTVSLTPFFYIAIFRYRNRIRLVLLIMMIMLYITFSVNGYIGRSEIFIAIGVIFLSLWVSRPHQRKLLIISGVLLFPFVLVTAYLYSIYRIGGRIEFSGFINAARELLLTETSFPKNVAVPIIKYGARANLISYIRWVITLPIPKIIMNKVNTVAINYDISEFLLGISPWKRGFYVVLPGLVGESIYIFGSHLFWLQAIFIGFITAMIVRLLEKTPQFLFLNAYIVMLFGYVLNRAGVSGALGYVINYFLFFYLVVFFALQTKSPHQNSIRN